MARTPQEIFDHPVTAIAEKARAEGVDTFVFEGDSIRAQTVRLTLEHTA